MKKSVILILFMLVVLALPTLASSPSRCIFNPQIGCLNYQVDSEANQLFFLVRNNAGAPASYSFMAWRADADDESKKGTSALSCFCGDAEKCTIRYGETANVTCTFADGLVDREENLRFELEARFSFLTTPEYQRTVRGQIFIPAKSTEVDTSSYYGGMLFALGIALMIFFLLFWVLRQIKRMLSIWIYSGFKAFVVSSLILFILVITVLIMISAPFNGLIFDYFSDVPIVLLVCFAISIPIGIVAGLMSRYWNKRRRR
ncbi:hypothetical protein AYK26_02930 [Euryarchaeota archaeon SM23-78]|nr:MAG: hypothetical protein AYK26_02930 [Euryarchaeota archaeon SM23-78]MBW3000397.1 hypothetical protein [Candidatus Woesearchaeota archaeon]